MLFPSSIIKREGDFKAQDEEIIVNGGIECNEITLLGERVIVRGSIKAKRLLITGKLLVFGDIEAEEVISHSSIWVVGNFKARKVRIRNSLSSSGNVDIYEGRVGLWLKCVDKLIIRNSLVCAHAWAFKDIIVNTEDGWKHFQEEPFLDSQGLLLRFRGKNIEGSKYNGNIYPDTGSFLLRAIFPIILEWYSESSYPDVLLDIMDSYEEVVRESDFLRYLYGDLLS